MVDVASVQLVFLTSLSPLSLNTHPLSLSHTHAHTQNMQDLLQLKLQQIPVLCKIDKFFYFALIDANALMIAISEKA